MYTFIINFIQYTYLQYITHTPTPLPTEEDGDVPPEYLIPKYELITLCTEAAKLKSAGAMAVVPTERLVRLMHILEKNIRDGAKVTPMVDEVRLG